MNQDQTTNKQNGMPCTTCNEGTMKPEGDQMVCDHCGHTTKGSDSSIDEADSSDQDTDGGPRAT